MAVLLSELPGLVGAKRFAQRLIAGPGIHAVLLYGAPGAGQDDIASFISQGWLSRAPAPDGPCETCQACGAYSRDNNPDYQRVAPHGDGTFIRKYRVIYNHLIKPVSPTTPINEFVRTGPLISRFKVMSLAEVDRMNADAANAFLKMLEEPEPHMRYVLATSEISRVLPTILSRCVVVACELPAEAEVRERMGDFADVFLCAPHLAPRFRGDRAGFDRMCAFVQNLDSEPDGKALRLAEDFRALCGDLGEEGDRERESLREGLELFAILVARYSPRQSGRSHAILEAHRLIGGNLNPRTVLDALFMQLA